MLLLRLLILCLAVVTHSTSYLYTYALPSTSDDTSHQQHAARPLAFTNTLARRTIDIIPAERTAYVGIHYERGNDEQDEISLTAVRLMMKTVNLTGSTRDRVVMVAPHTSASTRQLLQSDGLILRDALDWGLQAENPCAWNFRRIDLWTLTEYERVAYLNSDILVERLMDEIFLCGRFCMIYNSLIHFTDAVMVLKPDINVYNSLMQQFKGLNFLEREPESCVDEAWAFWIHAFGDIEAAPLFPLPSNDDAKELQYDEPSMRMKASVSLNAMLYYEKFNWCLMNNSAFPIHTPCQELPGWSYGFTSIKPYYWPPGIFFNLNWYWQSKRAELLGHTFKTYCTLAAVALTALYIFATKGIRAFFYLYFTRWKHSRLGSLLSAGMHHIAHPIQFVKSIFGYTARPMAARYTQLNLSAKEREKLGANVSNSSSMDADDSSTTPPNGVRNGGHQRNHSSSSSIRYNDIEATSSNLFTNALTTLYSSMQLVGFWLPLLLSAYLCIQGMRERNHLLVCIQVAIALTAGMLSVHSFWVRWLGADICGWVFGFPVEVLLGFVAYECIPSLTPPHLAWPTWILLQCFLRFLLQHVIVLTYTFSAAEQDGADQEDIRSATVSPITTPINQLNGSRNNAALLSTSSSQAQTQQRDARQSDADMYEEPMTPPGTPPTRSKPAFPLTTEHTNGNASDDHASRTVRTSDADGYQSPQYRLLHLSFHTQRWVLVWSFWSWGLCRFTFYPEFAVKVVVLFPFLATAFLTAINIWRMVFRMIEVDRERRKQMPT